MACYKEKKRYDKRRKDYLKRVWRFSKSRHDIAYIDETGFTPGTSRSHSYSLKGARIYGEVDSFRRPCTSLIDGYKKNKLIAPVLFSGRQDAISSSCSHILLILIRLKSYRQTSKEYRNIKQNLVWKTSLNQIIIYGISYRCRSASIMIEDLIFNINH